MLPSDFPDFAKFVATRFDRVDARLEEMDRRFEEMDRRFDELREELRSLILVSVEDMRSDFRSAGEGIALNRANIERNNREIAAMIARADRTDLRLLDHDERIGAIES